MKKLALVLVVVFAMGITVASAASIITEKAEVVKVMDSEKKEKKADSKCCDSKSKEGDKCCSSEKKSCSSEKKSCSGEKKSCSDKK